MALQQVNFGSASDGSQGDTARAAFNKINSNFSDTTNAASRLVGTAAGNLIEVGAFGLGVLSQASSSADLNTFMTAGQRVFTAAAAPNAPIADFGYLQVDGVGDSANRVSQTWTHYSTGRRFIRILAGSGWIAWKESVLTGDSPSFSALSVSGAAATARSVNLRTAGVDRFRIGLNSDAESGNSAGSNFFVGRYSDTGAYLDQPLRIDRASGETMLTRAAVSGPLRPGQYTLASMPSASAFTGYEIDVTDATGGAKRCRSDGTNWKILNTTTTVS